MKDFLKSFGKSFAKGFAVNRAASATQKDGRSFNEKNKDVAVDTAKGVAKNMVMKKILSSNVAVALKGAIGAILPYIGAFLGIVIIIILCILLVLGPLSYAYMMFINAWDAIEDGTLKISTEVGIAFKTWYQDGASEGAIGDKGESYEKYIIKRFMQIADKCVEKGLEDSEEDELKFLAVNWVYGKIYNDYFKMSKLAATVNKVVYDFFGDDGGNSSVPILLSTSQTAEQIYTPEYGSNTEDARKETKGDSINLYDILAFDFVAGTVFDLLDLDLDIAREKLIQKHEKDINDKLNEEKLEIQIKEAQDLFWNWQKMLYLNTRKETLGKYVESIGLSKDVIYPIDDNYNLEGFYEFYMQNYSYSSGEDFKWMMKGLSKVKDKWLTPEKDAAKELIKVPSDFRRLTGIARELENILTEYVVSLGETDEQKQQLRSKIETLINKNSFVTHANKSIETVDKKIKDIEVEVIKDFTDDDLKAEISENVKELNLVRTQEAAISYKEYLTALKTTTTVSYYTLDLDSDFFKDLYNVKKYNAEFFTEHANSNKTLDELKSDEKKYYRKLDNAISNSSNIVERDSIYSKVLLDSTKLPIVFAMDDKTGSNYMSGNLNSVTSEIVTMLNETKAELETIKATFLAARNGDRKSLIEIEKEYWWAIEDNIFALSRNEYFKFAFGGAYIDRDNAETNNNLYYTNQLWSDLDGKTNNSYYWQSISNGTNGLVETYAEDYFANYEGKVGLAPTFVTEYMGHEADGKYINQYKGYFNSFSNIIARLREDMYFINILRNPVINQNRVNNFYDRAISLINREIVEINALISKMEIIATTRPTEDTYGIFKEANISTVYKSGVAESKNTEYITGNKLEIKEYQYSQEECIKLVASKHYSDVLAKFKGTSGSSSYGNPVYVGDLAIGTTTHSDGRHSTVVSSSYYGKLLEYADLFGIDPNFLTAMIAIESGGNPNASYLGNYGLGQINLTVWGENPLTVKDIHGKDHTVKVTSENLFDPDMNLKISAMILRNYIDMFDNNLFMGLMGYNFGPNGLKRTVIKYLEETTGKMDESKFDPNVEVSDPFFWDYVRSFDIGWTSKLEWYTKKPSEGGYGGAGTWDHLFKILEIYDTSNGMPYVIDRTTKEKLYMLTSDADTSTTPDGEESSYHSNGRLNLWQQYYTFNDTFKNLDKWISKKSETVVDADKDKDKDKETSTSNKTVSEIIINAINSIDVTLKNELTAIGIGAQEFKAILAGTLNAGTDATITKGAETKVINCEPGFKVSTTDESEIKEFIKQVAVEYINIYKDLGSKDKDFGIYLYVNKNDEMEKIKISLETGSFIDFAKKEFKNEDESFTTVDEKYIKVAQIITGDLNVDVDDFYKFSKLVQSNGPVTEIVNPIDMYYEEWLNSKYMMHEMYNMMIEETNAKRVEEGQKPHPLLPTYDEVMANRPSEYESDIEGTLTVEGKDGERYSVIIRKKFLTEIESKSIGKVEYIVIHDTGSKTSGGEALRQYEKMNKKDAEETMHYVVGSEEVYHFLENGKTANHINDGAISSGGTRPEINNSNSFGIQFEAVSTRDRDKVFWHTVAITKYLMDKNSAITIDNVVLHNDVTGVKDSAIMLDRDKLEWNKFVEALKTCKVTFEANTGNLNGIQYKLVATAREFLGHPYVWGATGEIVSDTQVAKWTQSFPGSAGEYATIDRKFFNGSFRGFDCSGFTQYVYKQNGIQIGRTTIDQIKDGEAVFTKGQKITEDRLQPGDLLLSDGHVVMWIGNGEYIHATQPGDVVKIGKGVPSNITDVRRIVKGSGSFEFFSQHDSRWSSYPYSTDNISKSGCGVTSTAMVLSGINYNKSNNIDTNKDGFLTPDELAKYSTSKGTVTDLGTTFDFYRNISRELGVNLQELYPVRDGNGNVTNAGSMLDTLKKALREGKGVVASYDAGHWISYGGHLIALVGVTADNKIIVHDPNLNTLEDTRNGRYNGPNPDVNITGNSSGVKGFFIFG